MSNLKERLKKGESIVGTMVTVFDNPDIAKMLKVCGFDLFIIDSEHGYIDYSKVAAMISVAKSAGIAAFVRIPEAKREVILKYMEMGADGLLLPSCDTVEQAKALVDYSKYYPLGNRGVSLLRGHTEFEKIPSAVDYMKKANEETVLMIQVESPTSVDNLGDILDIEGIDAAFVGPNDLSQSYGIMGQYDNPIFIEAIDKVISTAKARNKFSGIHMMASAPLKKYMEKGMTFNLLGNDVIFMMNAAKEMLGQVK